MGIFDRLFGKQKKEIERKEDVEGLIKEPNVEKMKKEDVESLIKVLKFQKEKRIRLEATRALGDIGNVRAIEALIQALMDSEKDVRSTAEEALVKIGEPSVEPLIKALKNEGLRYVCCDVLAKIDAKTVNKALAEQAFKVLKDDPIQREILIDFLIERVGTDEAVKLLRQANIDYLVASIRELLFDMGINITKAEALAIYDKSPAAIYEKIYKKQQSTSAHQEELIEKARENWARAVAIITALLERDEYDFREAAMEGLVLGLQAFAKIRYTEKDELIRKAVQDIPNSVFQRLSYGRDVGGNVNNNVLNDKNAG